MVLPGVLKHIFRGLFLPIDVFVVVILELSDAQAFLGMHILRRPVDELLEALSTLVPGSRTVLNEVLQMLGSLVAFFFNLFHCIAGDFLSPPLFF